MKLRAFDRLSLLQTLLIRSDAFPAFPPHVLEATLPSGNPFQPLSETLKMRDMAVGDHSPIKPSNQGRATEVCEPYVSVVIDTVVHVTNTPFEGADNISINRPEYAAPTP